MSVLSKTKRILHNFKGFLFIKDKNNEHRFKFHKPCLETSLFCLLPYFKISDIWIRHLATVCL